LSSPSVVTTSTGAAPADWLGPLVGKEGRMVAPAYDVEFGADYVTYCALHMVGWHFKEVLLINQTSHKCVHTFSQNPMSCVETHVREAC
jgi:hypothetical protein